MSKLTLEEIGEIKHYLAEVEAREARAGNMAVSGQMRAMIDRIDEIVFQADLRDSWRPVPAWDLHNFRMGHFALYRDKGSFWGGRIVKEQLRRGFSRDDAQYTHIDVLGGGPESVYVNPPKVMIAHIEQQYPGRHMKVVRYRAASYDEKRYKIAFWASSHCNLRYDKLGVARFRIPWIPNPKRLYFCSENALWALQRQYPQALGAMDPGDCMPAHFLDTNEFEIIGEWDVPDKKKDETFADRVLEKFTAVAKNAGQGQGASFGY